MIILLLSVPLVIYYVVTTLTKPKVNTKAINTLNSSPTLNSSRTPIQTATPAVQKTFATKASIPPKGWTTREEPEIGIRFHYPKNWYIYDQERIRSYSENFSLTSYDSENIDITTFRLTKENIKINMGWNPTISPSDLNSESWMQARNSDPDTWLKIQTITKQTIGNKKVYKTTQTDESPMGGGKTLVIYYIPTNGNEVFDIGATPADSIHLSTLEKIIASLEFAE